MAEREEEAERLHRAMGTLSERERKAVETRFFLGLPVPEVAAAIGVSEEAAKKVYARALQKVGRLLRAAK